jgi:predicted permease
MNARGPSRLRAFAARLRGLVLGARHDKQFDDEVEEHLRLLADRFVAQGMSREEATRAARRQFGNTTTLQEDRRALQTLPSIESLWQDVRYATQALVRQRGFAVTAVLTLGLGIGLNASMFSIINAMLLRPLPLDRSDELVWIASTRMSSGGALDKLSYTDVIRISDVSALSHVTAYGDLTVTAVARQEAVRINGQAVVGDFFAVLGANVYRGRAIGQTDDDPAAHPAAVISFRLWERLFSGDDAAIGEPLRMNDQTFTVVGVAPRGFVGADVLKKVDVWVPAATAAQSDDDRRKMQERLWLIGVGRLAPGVNPDQATAALQARATAIAHDSPRSREGFTLQAVPLHGSPPGERKGAPAASAMLLGVTIAVLLIACANVANLSLVRGVARAPDIALRLALGASRTRILRHELAESVLLAMAGAGVALLLAHIVPALLRRLVASPIDVDFTPDLRVVGFTLAVSLLTVLVCGLIPALRTSSVAPARAINTQKGPAGQRRRLQRVFVTGQLALSFVLLVAAAVFLKSLVLARHVDVGFKPDGRVAVEFDLRALGYSGERSEAFVRTLLDRVRRVPAVREASLAHFIPLGGRTTIGTVTTRASSVSTDTGAVLNFVWPRFFETLDMAVLRGRAFAEADQIGSPAAAVVNQALATQLWPHRDAIGEELSLDGPGGPFVQVVGVVRNASLTGNARPAVYLPGRPTDTSLALLAWVDGDSAQSLRAVEREVRSLDARVAILRSDTLRHHIGERLEAERALSRVLGVFGAAALGLAAIGLYGLVAYTVVARRREVGVRVALGARAGDVLRLFVVDAGRLVVAGIVVGLPLAIGVTMVLEGSFFGVQIADPVAIGTVALVLAGVVVTAAYLPARRALRVDPAVALRSPD